VVKPSVAMVIFLSSAISLTLSFLTEDLDDVCTSVVGSTYGDDDDIDGVNISAIHFFERPGI
jgi:hypothetical protein